MRQHRQRTVAAGRGLTLALAAAALLALAAPTARADTHYGALTFPQDENAQPASWDYWWGAANLVTMAGNRYVVGMAFTSIEGDMAAGYQVWPLQGPYKGQSVMTMEGPKEWGHPSDQPAGRFVEKMTVGVPGTDQRLNLQTIDTSNGMKVIDRWERTSLQSSTYHLNLDQDQARVHPTGQRVRLLLDLRSVMRDPPLLAGGTGRWFYNVPEDFHFPSRGYQYMQAAKELTGTLNLQQPNGSILHETVDPSRSTLFMEHESDPPEDIPGGLGIAVATQLHTRYVQYYNSQWPWELVFADLGHGKQLMFDLQAYHDTPNGTLRPLTPQMPTYRVLATLRLPNGVSVPLNQQVHAEHLEYRSLDTIASATGTTLATMVTQAWRLRISFPGGKVRTADGALIHVPPFDLGFVPPFTKDEPQRDPQSNGLVQRVPFNVSGSYGGCPVHGFAWSELLVNWYGHEQRDPWFTGGSLPLVPSRCGQHVPPPSGTHGNLNPPADATGAPKIGGEGCTAQNPGASSCQLDAKQDGGIGGNANAPGGWTVKITRPGHVGPIVVTSHGGYEAYPCGAVRVGDHVVATAQPGSNVFAGDPVICF